MESEPRKLGVNEDILKAVFGNQHIKKADFMYFNVSVQKEADSPAELTVKHNQKLDFSSWFKSLTVEERVFASSIVLKKSKDVKTNLFDLIDKSLNESFPSDRFDYARLSSSDRLLSFHNCATGCRDMQNSLNKFELSGESKILKYCTFVDTYESEDTFTVYEELVYDTDIFISELEGIRK